MGVKKRNLLFAALFLLSIMVCISLASAQQELVVGVKSAPPFVIVDASGNVSGFSIDLMNSVAAEFEQPTTITYYVDKDLTSHFNSVKSRTVDFGIAATSITSEREKIFDFSYPFYESSLAILTLKDSNKKNLLDVIFTNNVKIVLFVILVYIFVCGNIIWYIERKNGLFSKKYFPGFAEGMWWTVVTMSTVGYGDYYPKKHSGKVFGVIVIISGISLFGLAIASVSSVLTLHHLQSDISSPNDLIGKSVIVIQGTQSVGVVEEMGMMPLFASNLDSAISMLKNGDAIAFVYDKPLLQYYVKSRGDSSLLLIQKDFAPSSYGIVFVKDSPLRDEVNIVLLKIMESGQYDKIKTKWFGPD